MCMWYGTGNIPSFWNWIWIRYEILKFEDMSTLWPNLYQTLAADALASLQEMKKGVPGITTNPFCNFNFYSFNVGFYLFLIPTGVGSLILLLLFYFIIFFFNYLLIFHLTNYRFLDHVYYYYKIHHYMYFHHS